MCFEPLKVIWLNALMHWPNQQWEQKPPGAWLGLVISCKLCDEHVALRGVLSSTSFGFVFRNKLLWISWTIEQLKSRRTRLRPNRRAISIVVDVLNYQQEVDETTRRCHFQATSGWKNPGTSPGWWSARSRPRLFPPASSNWLGFNDKTFITF